MNFDPQLSAYLEKVGWKPLNQKQFFTQFPVPNFYEFLPYLYSIEVCSARLIQAFVNQDNICIYSDYDTDAVTATATMYWGLRYLGFAKEKLSFYVPDRFTEGYGLNLDAITKLHQLHDLIISVDCGINSVKEAEHCLHKPGADLIITDHHQVTDQLPESLATINPQCAKLVTHSIFVNHQKHVFDQINKNLKSTLNTEIFELVFAWNQDQENNNLLSTSTTGVGVAWFTLVWLAYFGINAGLWDFSVLRKLNLLLPYVAIGTIADCQSVLDTTNRTLIRAGMHYINQQVLPSSGLSELLETVGISEKIRSGYKITSQDIAFTLSPILNASGRLTHASHSIALLTGELGKRIPVSPAIDEIFTDNYIQLNPKEVALELIEVNTQRKTLVQSIMDEVLVKAKLNSNQAAIWVEGNWSKGIIGLVASKLVSEFGLPVVVISKEDDSQMVGSLRAPKGYNLAKAISEIRSLLIKGGGHPGAAGFTFIPGNNSQVHAEFNQIMAIQAKNISSSIIVPNSSFTSNLPTEISEFQLGHPEVIIPSEEADISSFADQIKQLEPYGQDFAMPILILNPAVSDIRTLGSQGNHIKLTTKNGDVLIAFNAQENLLEVYREFIKNQSSDWKRPNGLWLAVQPSENYWKGNQSLQWLVRQSWVIP